MRSNQVESVAWFLLWQEGTNYGDLVDTNVRLDRVALRTARRRVSSVTLVCGVVLVLVVGCHSGVGDSLGASASHVLSGPKIGGMDTTNWSSSPATAFTTASPQPTARVADTRRYTVLGGPPDSYFEVWQHRYQGEDEPLLVTIEVMDPSPGVIPKDAGGRIAIVRPGGELVVMGRVGYEGFAHLCNPVPGNSWSAIQHRFEMVPAPPMVRLTNGEVLLGTLIVDVGEEEKSIRLPQTKAIILGE